MTRPIQVTGLIAAFATLAGPTLGFESQLRGAMTDSVEASVRASSRVLAARRENVTSPQDIITAAQSDYRQITAALYDAGYYGGTVNIQVDGVEAAAISPLNVPAQVSTVTLTVDAGARFAFGRASVTPLAPGTDLPDGFAPGQAAELTAIKQASSIAIDGWRAASHAKASVGAQRIVARHPSAQLDVDLRIVPGPALAFGQIEFSGSDTVRNERLAQIAGLPIGQPFSPQDLETAATRLRRSGVFRSVALREADTPNADGTLDISAQLVEYKPRRFGFGAEISSFEGGTLSAYWLHRNLFGGAERFRVDGEVSGLGSNTGIDYAITTRIARPATFWTDTTAYIEANIALLDEPDYYSRQAGFEFGLEAIITDDLTASAGLGYRYSDVRDDLGERTFSHIVFPLSLAWDRRDSEVDAKNGTYVQADGLPFVGMSGSATGTRAYADARAYRGFGTDDRFVLAGRLQVGSVFGAGLADTPPDLLFHSGGGGTVRGQPYQSLGVDLGGGDRVGGRSFLGASGEVRAEVWDNVSAVAFYDVGWIAETSVPGDGSMHAGAGIGVRYATGIGPIRLDMAKPVAGDTGNGYQIYVGIGQAF
ncbi:autotransporter assembly complex protein TamA [Aliiroseovarius sp. PTFE2010]|uniref:autotransporter assembly complex protein TamA n=1 Tax=Aliiroseovarius sp. PTFE2010 TaxID=3417190 RepID=UPI003CE6CE02